MNERYNESGMISLENPLHSFLNPSASHSQPASQIRSVLGLDSEKLVLSNDFTDPDRKKIKR